jgi:glutathione S-transferase
LEESRLRLYADAQFASPCAMSVFVALHEKKLPFDLSTVDLGAHANREASYAAKSMTQRVPTLMHGDFSLSESSVIAEYLDDAFPETIVYPRDHHLRARARQVGETSDITNAILFLDSAPFITGEILHVDGGQSAGR